MLTKRQQKILNAVIEEYIEIGEPVSSQLLEKKHNFGIGSAMIRVEMQKLTDGGYLLQPHTSAGRIPTDKSYRIFVDRIMARQNFFSENLDGQEKESFLDSETEEIEEIFEEEKDIFSLASRLTDFLARQTSSLAIFNLPERNFMLKEGWEELLKEEEFEQKDFLSDFIKTIEIFEKSFKDLEMDSGINVFIGKENPVPKAKNLSVISAKCKLPNKEKATLTLLGPKRMDYDKNISLIQSLTKFLEKP